MYAHMNMFYYIQIKYENSKAAVPIYYIVKYYGTQFFLVPTKHNFD